MKTNTLQSGTKILMKYLTQKATLIDGNGYIQGSGLAVIDHDDTISIGRSEYPKHELTIGRGEIVSKMSDPAWSVTWDKAQ